MNIHALTYSIAAACLLSTASAAEPTITGNPASAGDGVQVGISKRDGIRVDAGEAFITRNGATEKMVKELVLPSGVTMRPNGTMILPDKTEATLQASQVLTFEGRVENVPVDPAVNPAPAPSNAGAAHGSASGSVMPLGKVGASATTGSDRTMASDRNTQNGGGGSIQEDGSGLGGLAGNGTNPNQEIFVGADGVPFAGHLNADGSVTTADGRTIPNNGSVRSVSFDAAGNPSLGNIQNNGTVTTSDGRTIPFQAHQAAANRNNNNASNGSRANNNASNGAQSQTGDNGNNGAQGTQNGNANNGQPGMQNNNAGKSPQTNSPNNTGTTNIGATGTNGNSNNNAGTVNNPNGNPVTGQPAAGATGGAAANGTTGGINVGGNGVSKTGGGSKGGTTTGGGGHTSAGGVGGAAGGATK